eukprot:6422775-Prymnesium_polylepis.1
MRPLDPSVPSMREAALSASTSALRELVKRYPMMGFHQTTQAPRRIHRTPPHPTVTPPHRTHLTAPHRAPPHPTAPHRIP